jgi:hypothetical protein
MKSATDRKLLKATLDRLQAFESDSIERLTRLEENLRLLRQDLVGDGQPGRIQRLENHVAELRAEQQQQRGIFLGISFVVSALVSLLSRFFYR